MLFTQTSHRCAGTIPRYFVRSDPEYRLKELLQYKRRGVCTQVIIVWIFPVFYTNYSRTSSELSAAASVFVPGQFDPPSEKTEKVEEEVTQHPSVTLLYDAMYQLTLEPGRFDSIARKLTEDLNRVRALGESSLVLTPILI